MNKTWFDPWVKKIPWRRRQPTPVLLPGRSHGLRSWTGYNPWGCKSTGVGCRLLQAIFLTQGSNHVFFIGWEILYHWATKEAHFWCRLFTDCHPHPPTAPIGVGSGKMKSSGNLEKMLLVSNRAGRSCFEVGVRLNVVLRLSLGSIFFLLNQIRQSEQAISNLLKVGCQISRYVQNNYLQ